MLGVSGNAAGLSYSVGGTLQNPSAAYFRVESKNFGFDDLKHYDDLNEMMKTELKWQYTLGAGLEYRIPMTQLYVRCSYTLMSSPYTNPDLSSNTNIIGAGLGFVLSNNFIIDATFNYATTEFLRANYGSLDHPQLFSSYNLTQAATSLLFGFKYRF